MNTAKRLFHYFSKAERMLWCGSSLAILGSFFLFDRTNFFTLFASLVGVTSLIFNAKGNPLGPLLMVLFSLLYGLLSFTFAYYGEVITYLGMTLPMSAFALVSWMRNSYNGNKAEVRVNTLCRAEWIKMWVLAVLVTAGFYFILKHFHTANLLPSTLSVTTSFVAVYLTYKRSPYYAVGYAANDMVLIVLWLLAAAQEVSYLSVVVCFAAFLANDIYGYLNWRTMQKRQANNL